MPRLDWQVLLNRARFARAEGMDLLLLVGDTRMLQAR